MKKFILSAAVLVLAVQSQFVSATFAGDHRGGFGGGGFGGGGFGGGGFGGGAAGSRAVHSAPQPMAPQAPVRTAPPARPAPPVRTAPMPQAPVRDHRANSGTSPVRPAPAPQAPIRDHRGTAGGVSVGTVPQVPVRDHRGTTGTSPVQPAPQAPVRDHRGTSGNNTGRPGLQLPVRDHRDTAGNPVDKRHPPVRQTPVGSGASPQGPSKIVDPVRNPGGGTTPTPPGNGGQPQPGHDHGHGGCVIITPPYVFPVGPFNCLPCPPVFNNWCWFPGFGDCYGYCGGLGLPITPPVLTTFPTVAVRQMIARQSTVQIVPGTKMVAQLDNIGTTAGRVILQYGDVALNAPVESWQNDAIGFEVPPLALKQPVEVQLMFLSSTGELLETLPCELTAAEVQQAS